MSLTAFLFMVALIPGMGNSMELRPPPDAGIPDEELERLGAAADLELAQRFVEPKNSGYRKGILIRMGAFGNLRKPNLPIRKVLVEFVEKEISDCRGEVDEDRIWTLGAALEVIGQRGGPPGLKYLKQWITDSGVYERLKCSQAGGLEKTRDQVRRRAVTGIGLNGTSTSLQILVEMAKHPPNVKYPGSFRGVLETAISENRLILQEGVDKHFKSDRKFFVRRVQE